jgi:hypothetical protein
VNDSSPSTKNAVDNKLENNFLLSSSINWV